LATSNDEVDLAVGLLKCTIGVAPFGQWWRGPLLLVVVVVTVVVLTTSIIMSVVSSVVVTIITTITSVVVAPVVEVIATIVVAPVIAAVVAAVITLIPIIVARIGPAITIISWIRSTVTIVEALTTVPVLVVVAFGLLGGRRNSKGAL
jgi:hypothetical protein